MAESSRMRIVQYFCIITCFTYCSPIPINDQHSNETVLHNVDEQHNHTTNVDAMIHIETSIETGESAHESVDDDDFSDRTPTPATSSNENRSMEIQPTEDLTTDAIDTDHVQTVHVEDRIVDDHSANISSEMSSAVVVHTDIVVNDTLIPNSHAEDTASETSVETAVVEHGAVDVDANDTHSRTVDTITTVHQLLPVLLHTTSVIENEDDHTTTHNSGETHEITVETTSHEAVDLHLTSRVDDDHEDTTTEDVHILTLNTTTPNSEEINDSPSNQVANNVCGGLYVIPYRITTQCCANDTMQPCKQAHVCETHPRCDHGYMSNDCDYEIKIFSKRHINGTDELEFCHIEAQDNSIDAALRPCDVGFRPWRLCENEVPEELVFTIFDEDNGWSAPDDIVTRDDDFTWTTNCPAKTFALGQVPEYPFAANHVEQLTTKDLTMYSTTPYRLMLTVAVFYIRNTCGELMMDYDGKLIDTGRQICQNTLPRKVSAGQSCQT